MFKSFFIFIFRPYGLRMTLLLMLLGSALFSRGALSGQDFPRFRFPPRDHPLILIDEQFYPLIDKTAAATMDKRQLALDYGRAVLAYLEKQNVAAELIDTDPRENKIYLEILPVGDSTLNQLAARIAQDGFKLVFYPWRNLVHKIYNCKCLNLDLGHQQLLIGSWYIADEDYYAIQVQVQESLIHQYQQKMPVFLDAATLLTDGIGEIWPAKPSFFAHAKAVIDLHKKIFVPAVLRKKTEFAAYLGQTFNIYHSLQDAHNHFHAPRHLRMDIQHGKRRLYNLLVEVANRLAEINLIIFYLTEASPAVNFQIHDKCLEIIVAPLDQMANFYYALYLPLLDGKIPTTTADLLQVRSLQNLYVYLHDLHQSLRRLRPTLDLFERHPTGETLALAQKQILDALAVSEQVANLHPSRSFPAVWKKQLSATQTTLRKSLNSTVAFFANQDYCRHNFLTATPAVPPPKNKNNGKYFRENELDLIKVAQGYVPASEATDSPSNPSLLQAVKHHWNNWWSNHHRPPKY